MFKAFEVAVIAVLVFNFSLSIQAAAVDRSAQNRSLADDASDLLHNQDLGPPDHLDGVKLERDGDTNAEFYHEIFLGEEKHHFKGEQSRDEQLTQLKNIFYRADLDRSGKIDEEELHLWIMKMVGDHLQQATKDSLEKFYFIAGRETESVSYPVFEKAFYASLRKDNESHKHNFTEEYVKNRLSSIRENWNMADLDNDGKLTEREFLFFQHPEMSNSTLETSVKEFLLERDYDSNGKLDEKEFVFGFPIGDIAMDDYMDGDGLIRDKLMQFRKYIDANHDGFVSADELKTYMDPFSSVNARDEAHDMMFYVDTDVDGELSWDEVMEASEYLTGTKLFDASSVFHSEL